MSNKSFSFSMNEVAFKAWRETVPREKALHDAITEDLAAKALDRDDGRLTTIQRQACRQLVNEDGEFDAEAVVDELESDGGEQR